MKPANKFVKGQSTYTCRTCRRLTRQVGHGDCENVNLCADCYELSGIENSIYDGCDIEDHASAILQCYGAILSKKGDPSSFDDLRDQALKVLTQTQK